MLTRYSRCGPVARRGLQMAKRVLTISESLEIPYDEIVWKFTGSGGPGGQHANTANTRVEATFSIVDSPSLNPTQRQALQQRFGDVVRIVVASERSQHRNREIATERLIGRLSQGLTKPKSRQPSRPTRSSVERRLETKRTIAEKKRTRQKRDDD